MQQRHGYSKAVLGIAPPAAPGDAEENIVAEAFARYIRCESAYRARRPAALRRPAASSANFLPPRRAGAPGQMQICLKPEAERV